MRDQVYWRVRADGVLDRPEIVVEPLHPIPARAMRRLGQPLPPHVIPHDPKPLRELHLMTAKPFLYVFNMDPDELTDAAFTAELRELVAPAEAICLDAQTEAELVELPDNEALELLQSMGQQESGLDQLARVGFATLGLQSFLTAGPKEARAWTIPRGATAPQAAGAIHSDFERGFIKAEVVSYDDLVAAGSLAEARAKGRVRIEGKDYVMADGDVVEFRFQTTSGGKATH